MSFVTSVYVQLPYEDDNQPIIDSINNYLLSIGETHHQLERLDQHTGGSKHPQVIMLGGGFNYFPETHPELLFEFLKTLPLDSDKIIMVTYRESNEVKVWRFND